VKIERERKKVVVRGSKKKDPQKNPRPPRINHSGGPWGEGGFLLQGPSEDPERFIWLPLTRSQINRGRKRTVHMYC